MRADIQEAIEAAASRGNALFRDPVTPSARAVTNAREIILRFLQQIPDESMTVLELRTEVED